jgi:hypothetical protein
MTTNLPPRLRYARHLGNFPQIRTPQYVIVGQDGGQSVSLAGETLFLFSDTLLIKAGGPAQSHFLANSAAVASDPDLVKALASLQYFHDADGMPREILTADERDRFRRVRFWPEHGLAIGDKIYLYYLGVQTIDPDSIWGFRNVGAGIAEFDRARGEAVRCRHKGDWLYWRNTEDDLHFGVHATLEDGFVYVFGSRRGGIQSTAWLARVAPEHITERDAYEFLASSAPEWTPDFSQAVSLGPAAAEFSVSYNRHLGAYAMIYVEEYRKRLMLRTAHHLWGPYSEPADLIGVPHLDESVFVYLGFEHSSFQQQGGGRIFVSYCEPHFAASSVVSVTFDEVTNG